MSADIFEGLTQSELFQLLTPEHQKQKPWWQVAECYFKSHTLTEHQIDSYNAFMREKLPSIITDTQPEYTKDGSTYTLSLENVYIRKPEYTEASGVTRKLMPQDCRIRNLNYMCKVFADITRYTLGEEGKVVDTTTSSDVFLGAFPCMVLSDYCNLKDKDNLMSKNECPHDRGGYFIINGSEKVLMSQDRMAHNEIFVFKGKGKDTIKLPIPGTDKNSTAQCAWYAEVRSHSVACEPNITTTYIRMSRQQLEKGEDQRLYIEVPGLKAPVAWPIVFMAYGVTDKEEMISYVCEKDDIPMITLLMNSLDAYPIETQKDALDYLADFVLTTQKEQKMEQLKKILREKLFQNVPQTHMKKFYLGHMTQQVLATALGRRKEDDRDHYGKKRVETAGSLINNLFKSIWKRIIREVSNNLIKKRVNDLSQVFLGKITNYIKPPFATGNWTATKSATKAAKAGISQILNRHNYVSTVSNLRRVVTPNDKNSKIIKPRHLHNSQWCYICPAETPEGQATGLVKNLAMLTIISLGSSEDTVIDWLAMKKDLVTLMADNPDITTVGKQKVFVNGSWLGLTTTGEALVKKLRGLRRKGKIPFEVSISIDKSGVRIYTDEGRVLCPFFVADNGKLKELPETFEWDDLIEQGIIEYLDPAELETVKHSVYPWKIEKEDTHAMIHPSFLLGVSACTTPFPDHNQSPRNIYQSAMGKQALGVFSLNFMHRYDTNAHILCYPQKPMVNTQSMRLMGTEELPSGQNLVVAVMSAAYNQEDSVVINQRALDNGALRSFCYTTYTESHHRKGNTVDEIKRPEKIFVKETRLKGYSKLDSDGISKEGTPLAKRDVVIGKVNSTADTVRDTSVVVKSNGMEEDAVVELEQDGERTYAVYNGAGIVDHAILTLNEDSFRTVKVRVRQLRVPQIGDKVASRSAQKGIIGMRLPPENMPFSATTGMSPDLLMNPNAFPSRMTMSQALETLLGKACAMNGAFADCTPFEREFRKETLADELKSFGFEEYGDEVMINGMTGEEMPCKIFMGPTYYQRLKHMVDDKIHARDQDGPRETLTRQPVEGRKRGGGFRMGEMETWCGISHGAASFLIDRLVNNSDGYEMYVCDHCGNTAIATLKTQHFECKMCQQNTAISKIRIPYAFKLLMQELQACGIGVWINVDNQKTLVSGPTQSH